MKIERIGESVEKKMVTLLEERPISNIRVDGDHNIEITFRDVPSPTQWNTSHKYYITLTPDDLGKIMAEVYKQALTKSK